jgi:hypothetical protein
VVAVVAVLPLVLLVAVQLFLQALAPECAQVFRRRLVDTKICVFSARGLQLFQGP